MKNESLNLISSWDEFDEIFKKFVTFSQIEEKKNIGKKNLMKMKNDCWNEYEKFGLKAEIREKMWTLTMNGTL